jgi:hypothetical protein
MSTSGEINLPYAMLEQINIGIQSLGTKVEHLREDMHKDKVDLTKTLGDGNARMGLLEARMGGLEGRITQVELTEPIKSRHTLDHLAEHIKAADLPALVSSLNQVTTLVRSLQARDSTISESRTKITAIEVALNAQKSAKATTPHWALLALGTAGITTIISMVLNAWVVIPSAARAAATQRTEPTAESPRIP